MVSFWEGKRVLVTGGSGFIGSHLVEALLEAKAKVTVTCFSKKDNSINIKDVRDKVEMLSGDLMDRDFCKKAVKGKDIVMHLAARVADVDFNKKHPATMLRDNLAMFMPLIEAAREEGVDRFLTVSSAAVYPKGCTVPVKEEEGSSGEVDAAHAGYGNAKRIMETMSKAYHDEFGMKVAIARPFNVYGPRDKFDSGHAHVIASLITKVMGGEKLLKVWGDGKQTRSFIHVADVARGLMMATERCATADPVNLGSGEEVRIGELAEMIVELSGKDVKIEFDTSKPAGQERRVCDTKKAEKLLGFRAEIGLREGLKQTIEWYASSKGG